MRIRSFCVAMFMVLGLSFGFAEGIDVPQPLSLDYSWKGKTVELKLGQSFTVSLGANHSTGLSWVPGTVDGKVLFLSAKGEYTVLPPEMPGAPGVIIWVGKALAKGKVTLTFDYTSPRGGSNKPYDQFSVTFIIK